VARLEFAARAEADLDRIFQLVAAEDPLAAGAVTALILEALQILERHPLIGRPAEENLRELVISRGKSGYVALYEYFEMEDVVMVVALRHQREAGYLGPG
jgi:plasmid stabilization system protein ParE